MRLEKELGPDGPFRALEVTMASYFINHNKYKVE